MASISELTSQVADLSLADKLALIDSVVASIRKEGVSAKKAKVSKADKATSDKPKRKAALGTLAWTAYVKHIKTTQPEAFEGITKESEKLVIVKGIRAEDAEGYKTFTEAWKAEHASASASASASVSETESVVEPVPKKANVVKPAPKAEPKAEKAEKPAAKPKVVKTPEKAATATATQKPKPVAKAAKAKADEPSMPQKEIDGNNYWHHPSTNGLWEVTGPTVEDGTGSWIGYFQPGNDEEPIRFTDAFGDE